MKSTRVLRFERLEMIKLVITLLWQTIEQMKQSRLTLFDMGHNLVLPRSFCLSLNSLSTTMYSVRGVRIVDKTRQAIVPNHDIPTMINATYCPFLLHNVRDLPVSLLQQRSLRSIISSYRENLQVNQPLDYLNVRRPRSTHSRTQILHELRLFARRPSTRFVSRQTVFLSLLH